ncbi:unnamed protein product [Rhizophagus irregularis]|nr:unnamed protein product [Rhizophagus irregularis]
MKKSNREIHLSALKLTDIPQIVSLLGPTNINSIDIHENTFTLPNPYTLSNTERFVNKCIVEYTKTLQCNKWAIRNSNDEFIGCIGLLQIKEKYIIEDDQDKKLFNESYEIGYYISSEYRGLGIVSAAANFICNEIAFKELHLDYIIGMTFVNNEQSHNVLKRCGFKLVKLLKGVIKKGDEMRDVYLFIKEREVEQTHNILLFALMNLGQIPYQIKQSLVSVSIHY